MTRKVFVSGCFDLLHSGHVEFFRQASAFGELYVALGSDRTVYGLKGRLPVNNEQERRFMVQSIAYVKEAFISAGSGVLDFEQELRRIRPDTLVVNQDGDRAEKRSLCQELGIEYVVLKRTPHANLPERSTTGLRELSSIPYRIDLAGGWLDQPWVSQAYPGSVLTLSIEPELEFNKRSGMASSTRRAALDLWGTRLPPGDCEKLARTLFCYDNPPGTQIISGSQDSIGIVFPGLANAHYAGMYWPSRIEQLIEEGALQFVESSLWLVELGPRQAGFDVLAERNITPDTTRSLAQAAAGCWQAILDRDLAAFGHHVRASFEAQVVLFPRMLSKPAEDLIDRYQDQALGWKLSGAGGGGYLILVAGHPIEGAARITARRASG
jgi:cytidyltransferase-like protein